MSTTRLTFLYPVLFRSIRVYDIAITAPQIRIQASQARHSRAQGFATSGQRRQRFVKRHGKAVEPIAQDEAKKLIAKEDVIVIEQSEEVSEPNEKDSHTANGKDTTKTKPASTETNVSSAAPLSEETQTAGLLPGDDGGDSGSAERISESSPSPTPDHQAGKDASDTAGPLETVLQMPPPETAEEENASKPPHLQTPPYVHHFDTYTLVQQVEKGGFTNDQSITAMKAVRALLALNLDVAKAGLVSKSDVENETYLFRAACSELKTEIQNSRRIREETMRRERTLLQHEVEILNQKLTQELTSLKDDLKGMFDDRRMAVRQEQRAMESAIQELNYKITVALNSDSKSEVEGFRWVLTRRSALGILFMALMVLSSLRYASYKSHEDGNKKKKVDLKFEKPLDELPAQGAAEILAAN